MSKLQKVAQVIGELAERAEEFRIDLGDVPSARAKGTAAGTQVEQMESSMAGAAEILNRSFPRRDSAGGYTNVVSPVVIPKDSRSYWWVVWAVLLALFGSLAEASTSALGLGVARLLFGPHYWLMLVAYIAFSLWRNSFVMIPDGCQALTTKFGKLEATVGPGRTRLLDPRKKVSYIVNTTKEYPYNAPIREAPTASRVNASVDLFLQFRIEDPAEFIFTLGGVSGFSKKLENAISEVTRGLIYDQRAEDIYDLVGESTQPMLDNLNQQFLPAVRFVNANITHAEPSSDDYRRDLAAAEIVKVAKEAYTYQYELQLRKQQDEGELNKDLASLQETMSEIRADLARYQAQIDTAHEKEINRAEAYSQRLLAEADSEARANAALLEAQALDIRAVSSAQFPEILEYRYQQQILDRLQGIAGKLPRVIHVGTDADENVDFLALGRKMLGIRGEALYSREDLEVIRGRLGEISERIEERARLIVALDDDAARAALEGGAS